MKLIKSILLFFILSFSIYFLGNYARWVDHRVYSTIPPGNKNATWVRLPDRTEFFYNTTDEAWNAVTPWIVFASGSGTTANGVFLRHTQAIQMDEVDECIVFPGDFKIYGCSWNGNSISYAGCALRIMTHQYGASVVGESAAVDTLDLAAGASPGGYQSLNLNTSEFDALRISTIDGGAGSVTNLTVWLYCREVVGKDSEDGVGDSYPDAPSS